MGNRSGRQLSLATRRELIQAIAGRYRAAARADKKKILDEFIEVTGFHRKHAIRALRRTVAADQAKVPTPRPRTYDQAVVEGLTILWEAADRICGKRLKCAIPTLLDAMERHGHLKPDPGIRRLLLAASAATIDRLLVPVRDASKHGRRRNGISTPLRKSIAVRTFADWNDHYSYRDCRSCRRSSLDHNSRHCRCTGLAEDPLQQYGLAAGIDVSGYTVAVSATRLGRG